MFFSKLFSRSVHDDHGQHQELLPAGVVRIQGTCKSLTVWRKSLIISCNGFTVIDSNGNLVYRVDNYVGHPKELILMDGSGKSIFTTRRCKKLRLTESWNVYEAEMGEGDQDAASESTRSSKKPVWCVKKGINIFRGNSNVLAYVYKGSSSNKKCAKYVIEGSYAQRSCKVVDEAKRVVAEVKRKDAMIGGISFGVEVFLLVVQSGFDPGFAMALLVLLDQMFS
ncbi:hypothetical protein SLEP1_g8577 [Rubroshorea leprosula]|uniref:Protein LURP-one-related 17 n=1 Tax=Rubroshorea leprosula TaxID=152421 RepID=A0AAV5ID78_9ROSI|nr:hypothetical protein SLEP1_g8577 [Rubroshorea leprosula]